MKLTTGVRHGGWLARRMGGWATVGGVAGTGFEAYARILHPVPVTRFHPTQTDEWGTPRVLEEGRWPWREVARRQALTMHPLVAWTRLADSEDGIDFGDGWSVGQTKEGFLDLDLLAALTGPLAAATTRPDQLWAGIWPGWAELNDGASAVYLEEGAGWAERRRARRAAEAERRESVAPAVRHAVTHGPQLRLPGREYLLFATRVTELADPGWARRAGIGWTADFSGPSLQLLWPEDHAWVVASEIDWDSTIVAGPRSLVDAVLADDRFEAFEVGEDADLSYEGDTINPPRDA